MHMQFKHLIPDAASVTDYLGSMDVVADLCFIIIDHTDYFFSDITAVIDLLDQLVSSLSGTDHKYISAIDAVSSHITDDPESTIRIPASHDQYQ